MPNSGLTRNLNSSIRYTGDIPPVATNTIKRKEYFKFLYDNSTVHCNRFSRNFGMTKMPIFSSFSGEFHEFLTARCRTMHTSLMEQNETVSLEVSLSEIGL